MATIARHGERMDTKAQAIQNVEQTVVPVAQRRRTQPTSNASSMHANTPQMESAERKNSASEIDEAVSDLRHSVFDDLFMRSVLLSCACCLRCVWGRKGARLRDVSAEGTAKRLGKETCRGRARGRATDKRFSV